MELLAVAVGMLAVLALGGLAYGMAGAILSEIMGWFDRSNETSDADWDPDLELPHEEDPAQQSGEALDELLDWSSGTLFGRRKGTVGGRAVQVRMGTDVGSRVISVACRLPDGIRVGTEGFFSREDVRIGAPGFDAVAKLRGDPARLSASFGPSARADFLALLGRCEPTFAKESIELSLVSASSADLIASSKVAVRLAEALELPDEEVPKRLAAHAERDDPPGLLSAMRLMAFFPDSGEARSLAADPPVSLTGFAALVRDEPGAEAALWKRLMDPDAQVRVAAAALLERRGTVESLGPLTEASGSGVRAPVRSAIAAIQARVDPASSGGLSLPRSDDGRLSLDEDDPSGRVSLDREPS